MTVPLGGGGADEAEYPLAELPPAGLLVLVAAIGGGLRGMVMGALDEGTPAPFEPEEPLTPPPPPPPDDPIPPGPPVDPDPPPPTLGRALEDPDALAEVDAPDGTLIELLEKKAWLPDPPLLPAISACTKSLMNDSTSPPEAITAACSAAVRSTRGSRTAWVCADPRPDRLAGFESAASPLAEAGNSSSRLGDSSAAIGGPCHSPSISRVVSSLPSPSAASDEDPMSSGSRESGVRA